MSQGAAIRRRKQAKNGYKHLCQKQRPRYNKHSAAYWEKRYRRIRAKANAKAARMASKGKKK